MLEEILNIIPLQYILLIGGLIVLGELFKKFTVLPNKMLTIVLPLLGSAACVFAYVCDSNIFLVSELIAAINKGLCCGFAATGWYEFFMNTFIKKDTVMKVINVCEKIKEVTEEIEASVGEPIEYTENGTIEEIKE